MYTSAHTVCTKIARKREIDGKKRTGVLFTVQVIFANKNLIIKNEKTKYDRRTYCYMP